MRNAAAAPFDAKLVKAGGAFLRRHPRLVRFLLVGALNTAFGYGLFAAIFLATGSHRFAIVLATILGILFNFFTTGRVVFGNRSARALIPFVLSYAVTMAVNLGLMEFLVRFSLHPLLAQAMSLPAIVVTAYWINARIVFRARP